MWLKKAPINLFSLALLIAALYFTVFVTNVYAIGTFVFLMVCFLKHHWKNKAALKLVGIVGSFFWSTFYSYTTKLPYKINKLLLKSIR